MHSHKINLPVTRTARMFRHGEPGPSTRHVWICLHGYGQLASFFIRNFSVLEPDTVVYAPEALSRFYLDEKYERVGASWMTKEDRLDDITDNIRYLDRCFEEIRRSSLTPDVRFTLLGFSQGTATAWRWLRSGHATLHNLILWAGTVPLEFDDEMKRKLDSMQVAYAYGTRDPWLQLITGEQKVEQLLTFAPHCRVLTFNDAHRIPADALKQMEAQIRGGK